MSVRLSERQASSKRACPVDSGHSSLERAVSELQANVTSGSGHSSLERAASELQVKGDQKLLGPGRSSEPDFA